MVHCRPTRSHANLTENYFFLDFRVEWIVSAVAPLTFFPLKGDALKVGLIAGHCR